MNRFLRNPWFLRGLGLWQLIVLFTPISLYGFWTDVAVFVTSAIWCCYLALSDHFRPVWLNSLGPVLFGLLLALPIILTASLGGLFFTLSFAGTKAVPQADKLQGMFLVNQYFRPYNATGCGYGALTTAKAFVLFPIIEWRTDHDDRVHDDFGCFIERGSWEACGY
jgi:hypothetical protein